MKHIFIFSIVFSLMYIANAQEKTGYSAMMLSLNGEGVLIRNNKEVQLHLPQRFLAGDEVRVKKGSAIIMLFSGQEIPLSAVSTYRIPSEAGTSASPLSDMTDDSKMEQSLLAQSGVAYRIRGKSCVFPVNSRLQDQECALLRINYDSMESLSLHFKLLDSQTQKVIFEKDNISDSILSLADLSLIEGKSYYWILSGTPDGKPEMGSIVRQSFPESDTMPVKTSLKSNYDYLNAIVYYFGKGYLFETYALINEALEKYPDFEIYTVLLNNLLSESE